MKKMVWNIDNLLGPCLSLNLVTVTEFGYKQHMILPILSNIYYHDLLHIDREHIST